MKFDRGKINGNVHNYYVCTNQYLGSMDIKLTIFVQFGNEAMIVLLYISL